MPGDAVLPGCVPETASEERGVRMRERNRTGSEVGEWVTKS